MFCFIHTTLLYTHFRPPHLTHYFSGDLGTLSLGIPYHTCNATKVATSLNKTVEKIVYLGSTFLNTIAVPVLPSPPSPKSNVIVYSKESLIRGRLYEVTLNWGKGISFRKGVVLETVLLRRKVDMMRKTFSFK